MLLQRNQPTYSKLRQAVREGLSHEDIQKQYPTVSPDVLSELLQDVMSAGQMDSLVDAFLEEEFAERAEEEMINKRQSVAKDETLTDTAKRLRQENLAL